MDHEVNHLTVPIREIHAVRIPTPRANRSPTVVTHVVSPFMQPDIVRNDMSPIFPVGRKRSNHRLITLALTLREKESGIEQTGDPFPS